MAYNRQSGDRPAPKQDGQTPPARPRLKIQDGALSVAVFAKPRSEGEEHLYVVPERAYRDKDEQWVHTHMLHVEDLLAMAQLLIRIHAELRQQASGEKAPK